MNATLANSRFLSLAERYGKLDNIMNCQRKEAPERVCLESLPIIRE